MQAQTQDTASSILRELGGRDPLAIDLEDELQQEEDIQEPQQVDTRPQPKWFRSIVHDSRKVTLT